MGTHQEKQWKQTTKDMEEISKRGNKANSEKKNVREETGQKARKRARKDRPEKT